MMIWKTVICLLTCITPALVLERRKCCQDENLITMNKTCADNSEIIAIPKCPGKYILDPKDISTYNFTLDEHNYLVIGLENFVSYYVPPEKYCLGRLNETDDESEEAAIICPEIAMKASFYIKAACTGIALFLFLVIVLIYLAVPTLRDLLGKCIIITLLSLIIAYTITVILQLSNDFPAEYCVYAVSGSYLFFLIAYFWLNIMSLHILQKVLMMQGSSVRWFLIYCVYGFGTPVILLLSALLTHNPMVEQEILEHLQMSCWFGSKSTMIFIYGPVLILLVCTAAIILCSVKKLWNDVDPSNITRRIVALRCKCLLVFYIFLILGISWIIETLAFFLVQVDTYMKYLWEFISYSDLIQAILLFIVLVLCRKRTLRGLGMFGFFCISCPQRCRSVIDDEDGNQPINTRENMSHF